ncbi:germin-like protein subfamily 1 member 11 [Salvia divinorum]|uniref:Germin-like protein n=1 Tax=Salvia divinorum TaxID=28513 RepID=A0ABD1GF20_SALDI
MASNHILLITLALISISRISFAFDSRPLQDFCVVDSTGKAPCKDPNLVTADDFLLTGFDRPGNTSNPYGSATAFASVATVPGFNTLGLTLARADFAPNGYLPPHIHHGASEVIVVLEGEMEVGFITSYPEYKYYSKVVRKGGVFIVPVGLLHTVRNVAEGNSAVVVAFNSQNPGFAFIPDGFMAAKPAVDSGHLAEAFKLDENTVKDLQTKMWF